MKERLRELLAYVKEACPFVPVGSRQSGIGPNAQHLAPTEGKVYVDTGPILEREVARLAGLGWFGKNTMLINTLPSSQLLESYSREPPPPAGRQLRYRILSLEDPT